MGLTTLDYDTLVDRIYCLIPKFFSDFGVKLSINGQSHEHISSVAQKGSRIVVMFFKNLQIRQPEFSLRVVTTYISCVRFTVVCHLIYVIKIMPSTLCSINSLSDL